MKQKSKTARVLQKVARKTDNIGVKQERGGSLKERLQVKRSISGAYHKTKRKWKARRWSFIWSVI